MLALFRDFVVPDPLYLAGLVGATIVLAVLLYSIRPPVSQRTILAMVPWVIVGSALHVLYQIGNQTAVHTFHPRVEPLFSAPAVYLTTFVAAGTVWLVAELTAMQRATATAGDVGPRYLASIGTGCAIALVGFLGRRALDPALGSPRIVVPVLGLVASFVLAFVLYILLGTWRTYVIAEARHVGFLVLFAHVFDGLTTTIGVDILGAGERSLIPRRIMEFAADLPTEPYLGTGWLFLLVKVVVALLIVTLFAEYVAERPQRGNLLLAFVAFVGLGPALNNFFVFTIGL